MKRFFFFRLLPRLCVCMDIKNNSYCAYLCGSVYVCMYMYVCAYIIIIIIITFIGRLIRAFLSAQVVCLTEYHLFTHVYIHTIIQ